MFLRECLRDFCHVGSCCYLCWCFVSFDFIHFMLFDIVPTLPSITKFIFTVYLYRHWPILFQWDSSQKELQYIYLTLRCFPWPCCCSYRCCCCTGSATDNRGLFYRQAFFYLALLLLVKASLKVVSSAAKVAENSC